MADRIALPIFKDDTQETFRLRLMVLLQSMVITTTNTITASATIPSNPTVILANATSGAITVTLPRAANMRNGTFFIKKIDTSANAVTVAGGGTDTIDGAATNVLAAAYKAIFICSDGATWWILSSL